MQCLDGHFIYSGILKDETSSLTKQLLSFPSLGKVRGSKSQNEQEQYYHILVKMSAVIIEML